MEQGMLLEWLKKPGDCVKRGEIIAVIDTEKGAIEVEVFQNGVIERLLVEPGTTMPVGAPLAIIRSEGEAAEAPSAAAIREPAVAPPVKAQVALARGVPTPTAAPAVVENPIANHPARPHVSPAARKRAEELRLDLSDITGSGPEGAVTLADVERAAMTAKEPHPAAPVAPVMPRQPARPFDQARMRQAIGAAVGKSKREIPHYYLATTIDLSRTMAWLAQVNGQRVPAERLLPVVPLIKAVALAARDCPGFNGYYEDDVFHAAERVHVGVAVSIRGVGLIVPALHDADQRSLAELAAALRDVVTRARTGRLRASELADGTITLTSLGERGAESVHGVIFPPQVAIVGFGSIALRPWVAGSAVEARPLVTATLAADHRVTDGYDGSQFLAAIARLLQEPEKL
jgi:pyruvate dehydrogenase E2 component (dihydrolipoamide acetyltransferase)